jgi:hypothetical protein
MKPNVILAAALLCVLSPTGTCATGIHCMVGCSLAEAMKPLLTAKP